MDINSLIASQFHTHYKKLLIICTATATLYLIKRYIDKKRKSKSKREKKKIKEFPTIEEIQKFIEDLPFDAVNSGKPVTLKDLLGELSEFSEDEDWKELIASVHSMYQDNGVSDKQLLDTDTGSVICIYEDPNVVTLTSIEEFRGLDNRGNGDAKIDTNNKEDNSLESLLKNQGEGDKNEHI